MKKNFYFTKETEQAIIEYNNSSNQIYRNKIYKEKIEYPFFKLTQNIINTYKFPYINETIEDIQQEVICFLLTKLHLYTEDKGMAYSYFGTIAKRYLILENLKQYKKTKIFCDNDIEDTDEYNCLYEEVDYDGNPSNINNDVLINNFIEFLERNSEVIMKPPKTTNNTQLYENDYLIFISIIEILKNVDKIDIINKKAILLYLREMTNFKTPQIVKVLKKISNVYKEYKDYYIEYGYYKNSL